MKKLIVISALFALSINLVNAQGLDSLKKSNLKPRESIIDSTGRQIDKESGALRVNNHEYFKSETKEIDSIALSYLQAKREVYDYHDFFHI